MTSTDLKEELLKDIMKTGYPFEMSVSSKIQKKGWNVSNGSYYIDKDENKGREIDVIATTHNSRQLQDFTLEVVFSLIAEVKKSEDKPWIFFTSESSKFEKLIFPTTYVASSFTTAPGIVRRMLKKNTTQAHERLGRNFYQGFTKNNSRDDIYKALSGTTKATSHFIETSSYRDDKGGDRLLQYFESAVIIKDKLFEAVLDHDGNIQLNEVNYIQTHFNYLSPNYPDTGLNIVHVINEDYLEEFLNQKQESLHSFFDDLISNKIT